ncbi:MAG: hypothetical protein F4X36_17165 [Gammaproteobacteria bacterium]|nr:hypothetical protein [Gammaproteobacteria bacterium]
MNERDGLREVVHGLSERVARNSGKMGLLLDLNPFWRLAARLVAAGLKPYGEWLGWPHPLGWSTLTGELVGLESAAHLDFEYRSPSVEEVTEFVGGRPRNASFQPFLLRLVASPAATQEEREGLIGAARDCEILTVVNAYPEVRHVFGPGSELTSVVTGRSGTLGGYLKDDVTGDHFAVTCGHVSASGDFTSSGNHVGPVKEAVAPTPLPGGTRCHARCGSVTEIDIALVGVGSPSTNVAGNIAGIVCNGDLLTMDGARSGKQTYEVGGLVIEHEIGGACWAGLIQLHARRTGLLPVSLGVAMATMPQDGDSGAWVLNGSEWAGMVVASDKSMFGYAIAADTLVKHANQKFGRNLLLC